MGEMVMDGDGEERPGETTKGARTPRHRRSRLARWSMRSIVILIALAVTIAVILQIILWTDLPRRLIVAKLQTALGLRVEAPRMSIAWSGNSTLHDVKISLPLSEQSLLAVPRIEVKHTSLPMIILTQKLEVKRAFFEKPAVLITQDAAGRWNVAEAAELIARAGGKEQAEDQPQRQAALPAVQIDRGTVQLIDRAGKSAILHPLNVSGESNGPLVWRYDANIGEQLRLIGQISPGGSWEHEVAFAVEKIQPWLAPWVDDVPQLRMSGNWRGGVKDSVVRGRLVFDEMVIGAMSAHGAVRVQRQESGEFLLAPEALTINSSQENAPEIVVSAGTVALSALAANVNNLVLAFNGGDASLSGEYAWNEQAGKIHAAWQGVALPAGVMHRGSVSASLTTPFPGAPRMSIDIASAATTAAGAWDLNLGLAGAGRSWREIDWAATLHHAAWMGKRHFSISGLHAVVAMRDQRLELRSLDLPGDHQLTATGAFDASDRSWRLALDGANFPIEDISNAPLAFRVRASGKGGLATINELLLRSGEIEIRGDGFYDAGKPKPLAAELTLSHLPPVRGANTDALVHGRVYGRASVSGTLNPMDLAIDQGTLHGERVVLGRRDLGNIAIQLHGQINEQQARIETTEASLLGGKWRLRGDWNLNDDTPRLRVGVRDLPLAEIADLLGRNDLSGHLSGMWMIQIPQGNRTQLTATGTAEMHNVVAGAFQAERITADTRFQQGRVHLAPIRLERQDGRAELRIELPVQQPTQWLVEADVTNWPITAATGNRIATLSSKSQLSVDLTKRSAVGALKADMGFIALDRDAGTLSINSSIDGRVISVHDIHAVALGGTAQGSAIVLLDEPERSTGRLTWRGLDATQLAEFIPRVQGVGGRLSGSATVAPSDDPRALGPLKLTAHLVSEKLQYKTIDIGNADLVSFFDGSRFVMDQFTLDAAGGTVKLWARSTPHENAARSSQLLFEFKNLDLDRINRAFQDDAAPMPGRLAGRFVLIGSLARMNRLFGEGEVRLTESNLVNFGPVSALYDRMRVGHDHLSNEGRGAIDLRLDNSTLTLERAWYFNRGTQVRARAMVHDIWSLPESKVEGVVIGSLRPLKDIKLPYFADADRILNALQQNLTTVRIDGTVNAYRVTPITFSEAGETMRKIILGEVEQQ